LLMMQSWPLSDGHASTIGYRYRKISASHRDITRLLLVLIKASMLMSSGIDLKVALIAAEIVHHLERRNRKSN
jgi:hypothetical protein